MGGPLDNYITPVDFRISQNPQPTKEMVADYNFSELYDFVKQTILTFVKYTGVGTFIPSTWSQWAADPGQLDFAGNLRKSYILVGSAVLHGDYVNIYDSGAGVPAIRKAQANSINTLAMGYVTGSYNPGDIAEVIMFSGNNKYRVTAAIVTGQMYWLSTGTAGGFQAARPTTAGTFAQFLGFGFAPNQIITNISGYTPI